MKTAAKKTTTKKANIPVDNTKYDKVFTDMPVKFTKRAFSFERYIYMREEEFDFLNPRLIHSETISFKPSKNEHHETTRAYIYITDGTRNDEDKAIKVAYSYFVRYGERTWKVYGLDRCFEIIYSLKLEQFEEVQKQIRRDRQAAKKKK